jgi:hypothetical protein
MNRYLVLAFLLAPLAHAAEPSSKGLVAVLPVGTQPEITQVEKDTFEESIRTSAGDYLSPLGFTVLAGETTMQVLADNGVDAAKACEASCALQAARELRAKVFISGSLAKLEGAFVAFVRLFDTDTGRQLSSVRLEDPSVRALVKLFDARAKDFFGKIDGAAVAKAEPVVEQKTPEKKVDPAPAENPEPVPAAVRPYALRVGLGGLNGVAGLGLAYRMERLSLAIGTGVYVLSAGVSYDLFEFDGRGGFYVDGHLVVAQQNPLLFDPSAGPGAGLGVTAGYDLQLANRFSLKVGAGGALNSLTAGDVRNRLLVLDASLGVLF